MSSSKNPYIIGVSPDNALMMSYLLMTGKSVYVPVHLSMGSHSEQNARVNTLIGLQFERGKWQPQAHVVTYVRLQWWSIRVKGFGLALIALGCKGTGKKWTQWSSS